MVGPESSMTDVLTKTETWTQAFIQGRLYEDTPGEDGGNCKPRRGAWNGFSLAASEGTDPLDFQPPEPWQNKLLLLRSPSLWYFVTAAWGTDAPSRQAPLRQGGGCGLPEPQVGLSRPLPQPSGGGLSTGILFQNAHARGTLGTSLWKVSMGLLLTHNA